MRGAAEFLPVVAAGQALLQAAMPDLPLAQKGIEIARSLGRGMRAAERDESRYRCEESHQLAPFEIDHSCSVPALRQRVEVPFTLRVPGHLCNTDGRMSFLALSLIQIRRPASADAGRRCEFESVQNRGTLSCSRLSSKPIQAL